MTNNISFREAIDAYRKDEIDKYAIKYGRNIIKWIYNVLRVCAIQEGFNDITGFLLDAEGRAALIKTSQRIASASERTPGQLSTIASDCRMKK